MTDRALLEATSRVALAGLLHDLGKFAERARIPEADERDGDGNSRRDLNIQLCCPQYSGRYTHIHAAYTAIGFDLIERHLPELVGDDMAPFAPWHDRAADDSIVNAAARHHRPETFLQWVIATADRLASGFGREEFEAYNIAAGEIDGRKNHYTARQLTLLEQIRLGELRAEQRPAWRYPLSAISPEAIFPLPAQDCEGNDTAAAQGEYRALWTIFKQGLESIPTSHRGSLALWLDHFDSLWLTCVQAIPSATAGNVKPEVSLYDHARTTAALAVALWRWHHECGDDPGNSCDRLRAQWDRLWSGALEAQAAWQEPKFLLVQGDFFGIQDFIFAGGETQAHVARLLRGRSFHVSLLTECAALRVLDALDLPPTSQVVNAAGKFLIVAPNTVATLVTLRAVQTELDEWFLAHTWGQSGIGLAWLPAASRDFLRGEGTQSPFRALMVR
jgi:CRISPR-associated protein Csm1